MRIAVAYEDGAVFQHFGHTEQFKVYDIENGRVQATSILNTNGSGHGALADILKQSGVNTLICGGIGGGAKRTLAEAGIELYGGVNGDADRAVTDLLSGSLDYNPDVSCNHHGDGHDGGEDGEHRCHH